MLQRLCVIGLLAVSSAWVGGFSPWCSQLVEEEKATRHASLGAETRTPTADEVKTYGILDVKGKPNGQYLRKIVKTGPADQAGLQVGDVLLSLDANKLCSSDDIEDFLRVSQPGVKVKAIVKRGGTFKEEQVTVMLGADKASGGRGFTWQYAGLGQLDAALAAAKKDGKLVLIGLSGADT